MDPIRDLTWVKHLRGGAVVERLTVGGCRAVSLRIPSSEKSTPEQYVYRLLVFPASGHKPVLALNLERSILGTCCLTEQLGARHTRYDTVGEDMSYEAFRQWARERAEQVLARPVPAAQATG